MPVVSVDLAYKNYSDIGVVSLDYERGKIRCTCQKVSLLGPPHIEQLSNYLTSLCDDQGANVLLIDGPQGWKHPENGLIHSRLCERALNTPAKTGLPGTVKPANYTPFVQFSTEVFEALLERGWNLYTGLPSDLGQRTLFESFPMSAWRLLDIRGLPAKSKHKQADISDRLALLTERIPVVCDTQPTHDELQALVSGLAGVAYERNLASGFLAAGESPSLLEGRWREGFIVNPSAQADWRTHLLT